jgi:hypothetical protein
MDTTDQDCLAHERAANSRDPVSRAIQDGIVAQLRAMYRDLKAEPLPDHLLDLLKQLDEPRSDEVS